MINTKKAIKSNRKKENIKLARGFTLIELLIVVAIIAILAAIAIPNFLAAQTRSKVSRVKNNFHAFAIALESFRVDNADYPFGTDRSFRVPDNIREIFEAYGEYSFYTPRTRWDDGTVGGKYPGLTTPIAYITKIPTDPFSSRPDIITISYREDRSDRREGWILTSFGPDMDERDNAFRYTSVTNSVEARIGGRNGDICERSAHPGSDYFDPPISRGQMEELLLLVTYDPTNGTVSNGDLWRMGP